MSESRYRAMLEQVEAVLDEAITYVGSPSWSPSMEAECRTALADLRAVLKEEPAPTGTTSVPPDPECTCGSDSPRAYNHKGSCPHSVPWNDRVKARLATLPQTAEQVARLTPCAALGKGTDAVLCGHCGKTVTPGGACAYGVEGRKP